MGIKIHDLCDFQKVQSSPEGKIFVTKFELGGSFGMILEGDCPVVEVTTNLEFLVTCYEFGVSLS